MKSQTTNRKSYQKLCFKVGHQTYTGTCIVALRQSSRGVIGRPRLRGGTSVYKLDSEQRNPWRAPTKSNFSSMPVSKRFRITRNFPHAYI